MIGRMAGLRRVNFQDLVPEYDDTDPDGYRAGKARFGPALGASMMGASLYELATLQPAFPEEDRPRLLQQIATDLPKLPSQINRDVTKDLETIILKAMAKEPAERYATAQEVADDLQRYLNASREGLRRATERWIDPDRALALSVVPPGAADQALADSTPVEGVR